MAVLGLRFRVRAFSSCGKRRPLFIVVRGPLLLRSTGSRRAGSVVVAHGPSCSKAWGILPDQGSNPCPLHWQADSQPLCHQGSPSKVIFILYNGLSHVLEKINNNKHFYLEHVELCGKKMILKTGLCAFHLFFFLFHYINMLFSF